MVKLWFLDIAKTQLSIYFSSDIFSLFLLSQMTQLETWLPEPSPEHLNPWDKENSGDNAEQGPLYPPACPLSRPVQAWTCFHRTLNHHRFLPKETSWGHSPKFCYSEVIWDLIKSLKYIPFTNIMTILLCWVITRSMFHFHNQYHSFWRSIERGAGMWCKFFPSLRKHWLPYDQNTGTVQQINLAYFHHFPKH